MTDVKKTMTTSPLTINVTQLPEGKPANFSNGVGSFLYGSDMTQHWRIAGLEPTQVVDR